MMRNLSTDVRLAMRMMVRHPWSTSAIVATLALGIGASTAVYAVFNHALFRPVPGIEDEARLVSVYVRPGLTSPTYTVATHTHLAAMREMPAFAGLAGYQTTSYPVQLRGDEPRMLSVTMVSLGYFDVLGVEAAAGRLFAGDEYERPGTALAVISERLWRSALGGDPEAIGAPIHVIGKPFTVVGVARAFRGLERVDDEDIWLPLGAEAVLSADRSREYRWDRMVGRLSPNVSLGSAREQAAAAFERVGVISGGDLTFTAVVYPGLTDGFERGERSMIVLFRLAMAGSGLLLVLACANAAGMILSGHLRRRRDLALRMAIGASRVRVTRELLIEASVMSAGAAAGGLAVAAILTDLFRSQRLAPYMPALEDLTLDWRVGLFAAAAATTTIALAGSLPAILAARTDPQSGLRDFARGSSNSGRLRQTLTAVQVALSLALVASAGVLAESVSRLQSVDTGFEPAGLLAVDLQPRLVGRDDARAFFSEVERRLSSAPGIEAVGFASAPHLGSYQRTEVARSSDAPPEPGIMKYVSSDYFRAMRIPMLAGRAFTTAETLEEGTTGPAIVDELLAQQVFGNASVLGQSIHVRRRGTLERRRVIGVVGSTAWSLDEIRRPTVYLPAGGLRAATFQVRSSLPPDDAMTTIRRVVREVEPLLAVDSIRSTRAQIDRLTAQERVQARLGGVLAALALGLTIAGIYATVSGAVQERTRELGIRMALGASRGAIGRAVLHRAGMMAAFGLAGGLVLYVWASGWLESRLFGIAALDPLVLAGACALLLATALLAAWLPARRAMRVDPAVALRAE